MISTYRRGASVLLVFAALVVTRGIAAQEARAPDQPVQPHPEGEEAISRLRSPFCPGLMLEVCPSPQAKILRDSINRLAWAGLSADSLVEWMVARYGEEYRAVPRTRGTGLLAWVVPPLILLVGAGITVLAFRRLRAVREGGSPEEIREPSPEEEARIRAALDELESTEEAPF